MSAQTNTSPYDGQAPMSDLQSGSSRRLAIVCILAQFTIGYGFAIGFQVPYYVSVPAHDVFNIYVLSVVLSVYTFATIVGGLIVLISGDRFGRKKIFAIGILVFGLGAILEVTAFHPAQSITARAIGGIGYGFVAVVTPVWQAEASVTRLRGRNVILQISSNLLGGVVADWVGLAERTHTWTWRVLNATQLVGIVVVLVLLYGTTESSRWLSKTGHGNQHLRALRRTHSEAPSPNPETNDSQVRRRAALGILLQLFYALSGTYMVREIMWRTIEQDRAVDVLDIYYVIAAVPTWVTLCCAAGILVVERIGRRKALEIAFAGQAVCALPLAVTHQTVFFQGHAREIVFEVFGFISVGLSGLGYGVIWTYLVEINAQSFRARGTAFAVVVETIVEFGMSWASNPLTVRPGWPAVFLVVNALAACTTYLLCPETAGRSLDQLDRYFERMQNTLVFRNPTSTKLAWSHEDDEIALQPAQE